MQEIDRTRRIGTLIQREVSNIIATDLNDTRIKSVSVTGVTIGKDLKQATVYVSSLDTEVSAVKIENLLNKAAGFIRHALSQRLDLRTTPGLVFKFDETIKKGVELTHLIDSLNQDVDQNPSDNHG